MYVLNNFYRYNMDSLQSYEKICKLIDKWEETNKINNIDFLMSLIKKGRFPMFDPPMLNEQNRIYFSSNNIITTSIRKNQSSLLKAQLGTWWEETIYKNLTTLKETFDDFYGERWSFSFIPTNNIPDKHIIEGKYHTWYNNSLKVPLSTPSIYSNAASLASISLTLVIKIYFPEIKIRNRNKAEHTIKDLFVFLVLDPFKGFVPFIQLFGYRTTYSLDEALNNYVHSHLSGKTFDNDNCNQAASHFCLGSGSIIDALSRMRQAPTRRNIEIFIMELETYVSWESLEGGPYMRFERISTSGRSYSSYPFSRLPELYTGLTSNYPFPRTTTLDGKTVYTEVRNRKDLIYILFKELRDKICSNNYFSAPGIFMFDSEFSSKIENIIKEKCPTFYDRNLVTKDTRQVDSYFLKPDVVGTVEADSKIKNLLRKKYYIRLRNKQFFIQVIKKKKEVEEVSFFLNPKLINNVQFRMSKIISYKISGEMWKRKN